MIAVVGDEDVAVTVDAQAVGIAEHPFAPGAEVLAFGIEDDERIGFLAALEDVDFRAGGIGGDGRDAAELPAGRHGVLGLLAEADVDAILHEAAFVRVPALLGGEGSGEAEGEGDRFGGHGFVSFGIVVHLKFG